MSIKHYTSLVLLVLATSLAAANAHGGAIDLCDNVKYRDLCKSLVKGSKDHLEALEAAIKRTIEATNNTRESLAALHNTHKVDPKSAIETCEKAYEQAEFELQQAKEILTSKNYRGFKSYVSAAIVHYSRCENLITHLHETGPLASENEDLVKEISIVSDLSAQIHEV